jgi:hypothetical protein
MKNNMSIKKGKKQVYKVGDRVKVIVCAGGNPSHLGKTGTYKGTTFDETYPVIEIGKDDFCNPKKLSPLKPKKSKRHVHEYIPFDANAYPTLEKYAEYHQCKCGKEKPKKSIKKMYKVKRECDNCGEFYFVSIPFGTKKWDFFSEAASPKGKSIICKFCGC